MERMAYFLYHNMRRTELGRLLLGKTEFEVKRYLPYDDYGIGVKTVSVFLLHFFKSVLFFLVAWIGMARAEGKYFFLFFATGLTFYRSSFVGWKKRKAFVLMKQLSSYVGELRHAYFRRGDVEEAFFASFHKAGEELKLHLGLMEEAFESGGIPERYKTAVPSRALFLLLSICQCTMKYGDREMLFSTNLDELQKQIDSDLLKEEREKERLFGLFFILSLPLLCLPWMERWSVSQLGELSFFYEGVRGSFIRIVLLFLYIPVFSFYIGCKNTGEKESHPLLSRLSELSVCNRLIKKCMEAEEERKGGPGTWWKRNALLCEYRHFMMGRLLISGSVFIASVLWILKWRLPFLFFGFAILFSLGTWVIARFYPLVTSFFEEAETDEEIGLVRVILLSLSGVSGITREELLSLIEEYTMYLKEDISICIDELADDEEAALSNLREKWRESEFAGIVDDFIVSDRIGIEEAFRDLRLRREYYFSKRRQKQDFLEKKKEAVIQTFLFFPFMASVFLYMIQPFLEVSIRNLLELSKQFR